MWIQIAGLFIGSMSIIGAAFATEVGPCFHLFPLHVLRRHPCRPFAADSQPWHLLVTIGIFYPAFGSKFR